MTNLGSISKSRGIIFLTKVHIVQAMVFPVVMYGYESWTIKKTEHQKIDAFELWCWKRLLRVPWTARRSNQSILKEINPESINPEVPILWLPDAKKWLIWNTDAGKDWRQEEKGTTEDEMVGWHHRLNGPEFEQALGAGDGQGSLACCSPWGCKELDSTEWLNWITTCCSPHCLITHAFAKNLLLCIRCYMTIKPMSIFCHWLCDRHCTRHWREIVNKTVPWRNKWISTWPYTFTD